MGGYEFEELIDGRSTKLFFLHVVLWFVLRKKAWRALKSKGIIMLNEIE